MYKSPREYKVLIGNVYQLWRYIAFHSDSILYAIDF